LAKQSTTQGTAKPHKRQKGGTTRRYQCLNPASSVGGKKLMSTLRPEHIKELRSVGPRRSQENNRSTRWEKKKKREHADNRQQKGGEQPLAQPAAEKNHSNLTTTGCGDKTTGKRSDDQPDGRESNSKTGKNSKQN